MRGRASVAIELSDDERRFLEAQLRKHKAERSLSDRCRIVLRCSDGLTSKEVAKELGHAEHRVGKWRRRFAEHRIEGLSDEYRAGRPRTISDAQVAEIIKQTLETRPKDATHCSIRSMAAETGYSHTTIRRIWNAFGLQPHRSETFKLSTDPLFVDKVQDVVGLYMSPPNRAIVLCLDEKSQIQALDREQPVLPMARRPHWHVHFTPTSASWLNQVERRFAELTRKQIQRGVHRSVAELEADIMAFIEAHNDDPKPYKWVKSADEILASVKRFCLKTMNQTSIPGD